MKLDRFTDAELIAELERRTKDALNRAPIVEPTRFDPWEQQVIMGSQALLSAQMRVGARP